MAGLISFLTASREERFVRRHASELADILRRNCSAAAIQCHTEAWPGVPPGVTEQGTLMVLLGLRATADLLAVRSELGKTPNAILLRAMNKSYGVPIFGGRQSLLQHILRAHAASKKARQPEDAPRLHAMGVLGTRPEHVRYHDALTTAYEAIQPLMEIIRSRA